MRAPSGVRWGPITVGAMTIGIMAAIGVAASFGASGYVASRLVNDFAPALVVLTYEVLFGLVYISLFRFRELAGVRQVTPAGLRWALLAGVGVAFGIGSYYTALSRAPLSVAAPVVGAAPLAAYAFVFIVLRGSERITRRALLGAAMVVSGVVLIGVYNA